MKKSLLLVLLSICISPIFSQNFITVSNVNLRKSNNVSATVIKIIPKDVKVKIQNCSGGWCETSYAGSTGFVSESLVKIQDEVSVKPGDEAKEPVKYYTNSKKENVQSPTYYDKAPPGASALCNDGTYSFSRSRRGTCSHHGGVKQWL